MPPPPALRLGSFHLVSGIVAICRHNAELNTSGAKLMSGVAVCMRCVELMSGVELIRGGDLMRGVKLMRSGESMRDIELNTCGVVSGMGGVTLNMRGRRQNLHGVESRAGRAEQNRHGGGF